MSDKPLLEIEDLNVCFSSEGKKIPAVRDVGLTVYPGQTVAIVGESGSGKSTTAHSIIDLLPGTGQVTSGSIRFDGKDLAKASKRRSSRSAAAVSDWYRRIRCRI